MKSSNYNRASAAQPTFVPGSGRLDILDASKETNVLIDGLVTNCTVLIILTLIWENHLASMWPINLDGLSCCDCRRRKQNLFFENVPLN